MLMMNKRILLICAAGMSTSLIVEQIKDLILKDHLPYEVRCCDVDLGMLEVYDCDVVLLAPQISYCKAQMEVITKTLRVPMGLIDRTIYQSLCAQEIFDYAQSLLKEYERSFPIRVCMLHGFEKGLMFDLLLTDMNNYCEKHQIHILFSAESCSTFIPQKCKADIVMLEPQVSYLRREIEPYLNPLVTSFSIIDRQLMGTFQGAKILEKALHHHEQQMLHRKNYIEEKGANL